MAPNDRKVVDIADFLLRGQLGDIRLGMSIDAFDALLYPLPGAGTDPADRWGEQNIQGGDFRFRFHQSILTTIWCNPAPGDEYPRFDPHIVQCDYRGIRTAQSPDEFIEAASSFCSPKRDEFWSRLMCYRTSDSVLVWFDENYDNTPHRFELEVKERTYLGALALSESVLESLKSVVIVWGPWTNAKRPTTRGQVTSVTYSNGASPRATPTLTPATG